MEDQYNDMVLELVEGDTLQEQRIAELEEKIKEILKLLLHFIDLVPPYGVPSELYVQELIKKPLIKMSKAYDK